MIIKAKDFNKRVDLENYIRNKVGLTTKEKPDYLIEGTKQELNKLFLSEKSIIWGIKTKLIEKREEKRKKKTIKKKK